MKTNSRAAILSSISCILLLQKLKAITLLVLSKDSLLFDSEAKQNELFAL